MDFVADYELALRLLISFAIGTAIGAERAYRSKAAGLRTMIIICLGSTIFTELSIQLGSGTPDRIASNIVTGIGFLGAGVIFKDGLTISGITTATTIWISAALGMAVGAGEYFIAIVGSVVVLIVLTFFEKLQGFLERQRQSRSYRISFQAGHDTVSRLEGKINEFKLNFLKKKDLKENGELKVVWEIYGKEARFNLLNEYLKADPQVKSFDY